MTQELHDGGILNSGCVPGAVANVLQWARRLRLRLLRRSAWEDCLIESRGANEMDAGFGIDTDLK